MHASANSRNRISRSKLPVPSVSSPRFIQSTESVEQQMQHPDIIQELDAPPSDEEPEPNAVTTDLQTSSLAESVSVSSGYINLNAQDNQLAVNPSTSPVICLDRSHRTRSLIQKSSSQTLIIEAPLIALADDCKIPQKVKLEIEELKRQVMFLSKMNEEFQSRLNALTNNWELNPNIWQSPQVIRQTGSPIEVFDSPSLASHTKRESETSIARSSYSFGPKVIMKRD